MTHFADLLAKLSLADLIALKDFSNQQEDEYLYHSQLATDTNTKARHDQMANYYKYIWEKVMFEIDVRINAVFPAPKPIV